ncbi:MAG: hypothetical protein IJX20_04380, partial [Alphaproteobacteria bacterium]|nr:hypothetical protein [Alphaproteobacteria bacterium]
MIKKSAFIISLLTSTVLTQNVSALTLTPTLNSLKTEAAKLTSSDVYTLTELGSNTLPEGAVKVMVGGVAYYFEPTGDNKELVSTLAGTPAGMVTENEGTYSISFDASKLPDSVFSYVTGFETDYNFTVQEADANGELTTKYYKIVLDKSKIGISENITYDVVTTEPTSGTYVTLTLPNDKKVYVTYEYDDTTERKVYDTQQNNSLTGDVDADFVGSKITSTSSTVYGGAIYNSGTIGNITGDFIGNYASGKYAYGGAIYNESDGTIGDITGDFIGNYAKLESLYASAYGGAIANYGTIGNITGDFIGNYASGRGNAYGGAIANYGTYGTIGNITGDFIGNYAKFGGAIYNYYGTIGNITGDFIGNYAPLGGAIYNGDRSAIGNIIGDFIGNYANGTHTYGGAIYNKSDSAIGDITGDFIGNYASGGQSPEEAYGGAIYNYYTGTIGNITGDFIGNYASGSENAYGGAIHNYGTISNIIGDFIGNYVMVTGTFSFAQGGAIYNSSRIGNITGDFIGNYASGVSASGGTIFNEGNIGNITGDFIGNYAKFGGAIFNEGNIGNITGDFIGNYASGKSSYGGAIYNHIYINKNTIGDITGDFIGNYAKSGGAIYNDGTIGDITGDFIGNYAGGSLARGGAIYNISTIGNITGDFIGNYAKTSSDSDLASGGAVYIYDSNMTFTSGAEAHQFSGNYTSDVTRGKNYNAIFVNNTSTTTNPVITFDTTGGGSWTINDNIEGGKASSSAVDYTYKYDLSFVGDDVVDADLGTTTQFVAMNNAIINAENVTVDGTTLKFGSYNHEDTTANNWEGQGKFIASLEEDGTENLTANSVTSLTLNNAVFDVANGYIDNIYLKGFSSNNSFYHIDLKTDTLEADVLHIDGNVDPNNPTSVIVHASSDADIRGKSILFVHSTNDTTGQADSFKVSRVYGSPYLYDVLFNVEQSSDGTATVANTNENKWYLSMNNIENPNKDTPPSGGDDDNTGTGGDDGNTGGSTGGNTGGSISKAPIKVTPEIIGGISLPTVTITQKVGMISTIKRKVGISHLYSPDCEFCSYNWDGKPNHNAWVDIDYTDLSIDAPVDIDAKVWGIEAGFDLQHDKNNKLGVFVSYRTGNYDMNGDGKEYYSTKSSEIESKSYLGGLYYFHD